MESKDLNGFVHAFVLAGGKGKRMSEYTSNIPKPLVCVKEKPLIEYSLDALLSVGINSITLVISDSRISQKYKTNYLWTNGTETILYVIHECLKALNAPYALFLDGDSVYASGILNGFFRRMDWNNMPDMIVGTTENSFSYTYWSFLLENDRILDVKPQKNKMPHYAIFVKTSSATDVFKRLSRTVDIHRHKMEDHFVRGYEQYYLGWGLIYKLFLENNYVVKLDRCRHFFANVNTIQDIDRCASHDF